MTVHPFEPMTVVWLAARLYLGGFLLLSASRKLQHPTRFVAGVADYRILPARLAHAFGVVLPWGELAIAITLLSGFAVPIAGIAAAIMLSAFMVAVVLNIRRGRIIPCNCFGIAGTAMIGWGTVGRNVILLAIALGTVALSYPFFGDPVVSLAPVEGLRYAFDYPDVSIQILLLICWLAVVVALVEWSLDVRSRVASLRQRLQSISDDHGLTRAPQAGRGGYVD
jgi:uncharacterized membrane protein YphA (DoxX/SURF4 family)